VCTAVTLFAAIQDACYRCAGDSAVALAAQSELILFAMDKENSCRERRGFIRYASPYIASAGGTSFSPPRAVLGPFATAGKIVTISPACSRAACSFNTGRVSPPQARLVRPGVRSSLGSNHSTRKATERWIAMLSSAIKLNGSRDRQAASCPHFSEVVPEQRRDRTG
jgi:hypothetical protein